MEKGVELPKNDERIQETSVIAVAKSVPHSSILKLWRIAFRQRRIDIFHLLHSFGCQERELQDDVRSDLGTYKP